MRLTALTAAAALALSCWTWTAAAADQFSEPERIVRQTTERLLRDVATRNAEFRADPQQFYAYVDEVVASHFDWPYITRLLLGPYWKQATEEQRERFARAFRNMLIRTYADALLEYHDAARVEWLPAQPGSTGRDVMVRARLLRDGSKPIPVGFAMLERGGTWRIYDVIIESSSVATSFRGQFIAEIRANGLESLIQRLERGESVVNPVAG